MKVYLLTSVDSEHSYDDEEILNQGIILCSLEAAKACADRCCKTDLDYVEVAFTPLTWSENSSIWLAEALDGRFTYQLREIELDVFA